MRLNLKSVCMLGGVMSLIVGVIVGPALDTASASAKSNPYANVNLTISVNAFGPQADNLNPFLPTSTDNSSDSNTDMIYEPLWEYNIVDPSKTYPWLATSRSLTNGDKTLTLTLHKDVKWSDGKPFTSADVVFTFDILKKYPALNTNGITFKSVVAQGPLGVKFTFSTASFPEEYYILQTPIVPEHIWSKVKNPVTYADTDPIGTGPFVLKSFTPQYMVLDRNPNYWQAGLPKVNSITYPSVGSAAAQNSAMDEGEYTWSSFTEPDIQKLFISKDPKTNHYWYPPVGITALLPNMSVYPLNLTAVRQAISLAVNRKTVSKLGEWGYEPPIKTATGLILPNYSSSLDPSYKNDTYSYNVTKAKSLLKSAGLKTNSSGQILGKNGQPITLSLIDPSGYSDYMQDLTILSGELKAIGFNTSVQGTSVGTWTSDLATGDFDLSLYYSTTGPTPYYIYNAWLNYSLSAKQGGTAAGDFQRWDNAATQSDLAAYTSAVTNAQRTTAIDGLEKIMVDDLPVIPLVYSIDWGAYTSNVVTGWPSPSDAYSSAGPIENANQEFVLLHLVPAKS